MIKITLKSALKSLLPLFPFGSSITIEIHDYRSGKHLIPADHRKLDATFNIGNEYDDFNVTTMTMTDQGKYYSLYLVAVKEEIE